MLGLWTKLNLKKDKFLAKGDNESLKQKTNHHPPHNAHQRSTRTTNRRRPHANRPPRSL